jgi:hypothetical protein
MLRFCISWVIGEGCRGRRGVAYVHGAHGAHIAAVVHIAVAHVAAVVHSGVVGVIHDVWCYCLKGMSACCCYFKRCYAMTGSAVWSKDDVNDNVLNI